MSEILSERETKRQRRRTAISIRFLTHVAILNSWSYVCASLTGDSQPAAGGHRAHSGYSLPALRI